MIRCRAESVREKNDVQEDSQTVPQKNWADNAAVNKEHQRRSKFE